MEDVISLIRHLLTTPHSINRVDSIVKELNISKERLLQLVNENLYQEYFQLLRPSPHHTRGTDKLALTLDVRMATKIRKFQTCLNCCHLALLLYTLRSSM
jgi:hypothetical protein